MSIFSTTTVPVSPRVTAVTCCIYSLYPVILSSSTPYFNISMSVFVCQYLTWSVIIHLMSFIVITFWPADVLVLDAMATAPVNTVILSGLMLVCKCWEVALMSRPVVSVLKVSTKFCSNFHGSS